MVTYFFAKLRISGRNTKGKHKFFIKCLFVREGAEDIDPRLDSHCVAKIVEMQTVGCDGREVLVCDARKAVLVNEVPVGIVCGTGEQCQFVVGQCATNGVLAGACVIRIITFQGIAEDDDDITAREDFDSVNLASVGPKEWFKSSKGVSAASLAKVTPVAPLVKMSKTDRRFIEGYEVADTLDDSVNLAAIDWQDFEHLIREIFEKEFKTNGGEVKITQASRDGGVDAVAFDPDPIRGGKIVIQAKRYTNVVGVSAVRDLYGTVMNEGAIKGILVTTSNYGNDAYEFAT